MKFKGHRRGVTRALYRALKRKERQGDVVVVIVDEFRTSRVKQYYLILLSCLATYRYAILVTIASDPVRDVDCFGNMT